MATWCCLVAAACSTSPILGDEPTSQAPEQSPTSHALVAAVRAVDQGKVPAQHSLLVYQRGSLLLEHYWPGRDGRYGLRQFGPNELHDLRSCTKSVVGLLFGIGVEEGLIPHVGTPAHTVFSGVEQRLGKALTPAHRRITLEHLLLMTDGLKWNQDDANWLTNNELWLERARDPSLYVWSRPMARTAGKEFNYNSGATALLGSVIQIATDADIESFARKRLFEPLGITKWEWKKLRDGAPGAHYGLRLTSRDMLKIGQLVLQKGTWSGNQIVSSKWLNAIADRQQGKRNYGYQWWLDTYNVNQQEIHAVAAGGKGGQYIHVLPGLEAVVVMTAGHYDDPKSAGDLSFQFLEKYILPPLLNSMVVD